MVVWCRGGVFGGLLMMFWWCCAGGSLVSFFGGGDGGRKMSSTKSVSQECRSKSLMTEVSCKSVTRCVYVFT